MEELNETFYTITNWDKSVDETMDRNEARMALKEGRDVVKSARKIFTSGSSLIQLYVTTPIKKAKEL